MLYTSQPKKMLVMSILDILKRYSDENHRLSQKEIEEILEREYGLAAERKAIKRNLGNLIDFGYAIEYSENVRTVPDRETGGFREEAVQSDFYLSRDFDDSELRLLIDSLLFSKHIPYSQCRRLVEKLEGLSSVYFRSRVKHIQTLPESMADNKQLFYTVDVLDEAIEKGRKVSFNYNEYHLDKKLHLRRNRAGEVITYTVNPYQIAAANGRYYLIANHDAHDSVSHYRIDRIANIRLLDEPRKPAEKVAGLEQGLRLPEHMAEHLYMYAGESESVTFRFKKCITNDVFDWFGKTVLFSDETDGEVTARVTVNLAAMRRWALQYGPCVRVLGPEKLVDEIKADLAKMNEQYGIGS